jgi:N-methylhydantoinase A
VSYVCGVDIGGTFTDCVVIDDSGRVQISKAPSTPGDFSEGFFESLRLAAGELNMSLEDLFGQTVALSHGTTVATNAVIERRGSKVGLLTTAGHGDAILIMRAMGRVAGLSPLEQLHFATADKPVPIVPRSLIREVHERIDCKGEVVVELDEVRALEAVDELIAAGAEGIAISLLWSFKNSAHEHRLRDLIADRAPGLFVTCSCDLMPLLGEYERTVATVMNDYVGPVTSRYIDGIEGRARSAKLKGPFLLMQCNGGLTSSTEAKRSPVLLLQSGPSGGVVGSRYLGSLMGYPNIIATDMGGTTFDVGLVHDGQPARTATSVVGQYEYYVPTIDVKSIGAGGGSIAWYDPIRESLRIGPQSAGADPGPVCYGRGGTQPTVTDADVVLGYIDPEYFLGGRAALDGEAARRAIAELGAPLGIDALETAAGIAQIADFHMADLIRKMTIEKGHDPRDFVIFTYGGAGPVHAGVYAQELGVGEVVVPLASVASVWSALGVASSDVVHVHQREDIMPAPLDAERVRANRERLREEALAELRSEGFSDDQIALAWTADLRHRLQVHVVEIPFPDGEIGDEALDELLKSFERTYESLYGKGTAYTAAGVELVTLRCTASGLVIKPAISRAELAGADPPEAARARSRQAYWPSAGGLLETDIYRGTELMPGNALAGPAIIELPVTTIVVHPGQTARVDGYRNVVITLGGEEANA